MNTRGSYRALRDNSRAALLASIEIYNKPQMAYRDECFVILLVNAWELLLKAILSKNRERIYYPKKRGFPYRTFSLKDALRKARPYFSILLPFEPVAKNLELLSDYRDNCIHFYNQPDFGIIVYSLAQQSILNYCKLMSEVFAVDISDDMTIVLLPLGLGRYPDPLDFIEKSSTAPPRNRQVTDFLARINQAIQDLEKGDFDTSHFMTHYKVSLQSVKKASSADFTVGVSGSGDGSDRLIIQRKVDPNVSHPLRQTDIIEEVGADLHGIRLTSFVFQAIAWKTQLKDDQRLCWRLASGGVVRYSRDVVPMLKRMPASEIQSALDGYRVHLKRIRKEKHQPT